MEHTFSLPVVWPRGLFYFIGGHSNSSTYLVGIQGSVMAALIPSLWPLTHFLGLVTVAVGGVG